MAETILDQGTVWWPAGLGKLETVRCVFNVALQTRPSRFTCQDYETREAMAIEVVDVEHSGSGDWTRYTAVTFRFPQPDQRGRSFRWRATA